MIYNLRSTYKDVGMKRLGKQSKLLSDYVENYRIDNYILLNTCNRAELYSLSELDVDGFYKEAGTDAVRHLFRVACGLDSMIIGENEILGQINRAKKEAEEEGHLRGELLSVFDYAVKLGSSVRAKTKISKGKTSIASLAVEHVLKRAEYPAEKVLVIGSGAMGAKIAVALKNRGVQQIFLANRRWDRANAVAERVNGVVTDYRRLPEFLGKMSVVFTATSSPHAIIRADMIPPARKMLIVDLGVPYDVSMDVDRLRGVEVVRLSHFREIAENNALKKAPEVAKVQQMIDESLNSESSLFTKHGVVPIGDS